MFAIAFWPLEKRNLEASGHLHYLKHPESSAYPCAPFFFCSFSWPGRFFFSHWKEVPSYASCFSSLKIYMTGVSLVSLVLEQELSFPYLVGPLMKVLISRINGGLINLPSECHHWFIRISLAWLANSDMLIMPYSWQCCILCSIVAILKLASFSSLLTLKTDDQTSFKNVAISKLECCSDNETMLLLFLS